MRNRFIISFLFISVQSLMGMVSALGGDALKVEFAPQKDVLKSVGENSWEAPATVDSFLKSQSDVPAGWYMFKAEYKTKGFNRLGTLGCEARSMNWKETYSAWNILSGQPEWAELTIYINVTQDGPFFIRFCDRKGVDEDSMFMIRNPKLILFKQKKNADLLPNSSLSEGTMNTLPAMWYLEKGNEKEDDSCLVKNKSYKKGKHVMRLQSNDGSPRFLNSTYVPFPDKGSVTLTIWAKGDKADSKLGLWIIGKGWSVKANAIADCETSWKKYSVTLPIPEEMKKSYLWVRLDLPRGGSPVEVADSKLVWDPSGSSK
ncbi:MAG: hypothetical protein JXR97_05200 [Planctomycetes bacterium]|nr:hypothetical protein [Planctomycetota bacterium]